MKGWWHQTEKPNANFRAKLRLTRLTPELSAWVIEYTFLKAETISLNAHVSQKELKVYKNIIKQKYTHTIILSIFYTAFYFIFIYRTFNPFWLTYTLSEKHTHTNICSIQPSNKGNGIHHTRETIQTLWSVLWWWVCWSVRIHACKCNVIWEWRRGMEWETRGGRWKGGGGRKETAYAACLRFACEGAWKRSLCVGNACDLQVHRNQWGGVWGIMTSFLGGCLLMCIERGMKRDNKPLDDQQTS